MSKNISNLSGRIGLKNNLFQKLSDRSLNSNNGDGIKEIAEEYNIVAESQWPEISRFDPAAMAIGLRPGQVAEITRKSPTALDTKYYRLCVDGGLK